MPIENNQLLELTKNSKSLWYKNDIPITRDEQRKYKCANPEGPVDNSSCPPDDPYCNCPAKELQPKDAIIIRSSDDPFEHSDIIDQNGIIHTFYDYFINDDGTMSEFVIIDSDGEELGSFDTYDEAKTFIIEEVEVTPEPTDDELHELEKESKYCELIEEELGEEYLGCDWNNPDSPESCSCPNIGPKYKEWKRYSQTYSTYWNTPKEVPLLRNAQMTLITSQRAVATVNGDFSIRPGSIIDVEVDYQDKDNGVSLKSSSGRWLVAEISHNIEGANVHAMVLTLIRDSFFQDPNGSETN